MATMNVVNSSGQILYPYSPGGGIGSGGGGGTGGGGTGGGGSGVGGGGPMWSDSDQLIWIQVDDGAKYPVWLEPGWNDVHFWIPSIYPDDVWIDAPIIIEAPGYILIPAGFEWEVVTSPNAPEKLGNQKMSDRLRFVDIYDIEIQEVPKPIDLDNIIDEIKFEDFITSEIINTSSIDTSEIEELTFEDFHQIEIELPPFSGEYNHIDEISFEDVNKVELINTTILNSDNVEQLGIEDIHVSDKVTTTKEDSSENETMGFEDVYQIDIE